jgi:hypothetical protein
MKEVAGRIAADEFRHYRLFYDILTSESEPELPIWRKLWVAATRVNESDDDELACAYYCANVPAADMPSNPYRRRRYARLYQNKVMAFYRRHHIDRLVKMVVKPAGLNPSGRISRMASAFLWRMMTLRASSAGGNLTPA